MTRLVRCKEGMLRMKKIKKRNGGEQKCADFSTQRDQKQMEQISYGTWLSFN